jgi:hypothetical protein
VLEFVSDYIEAFPVGEKFVELIFESAFTVGER